jgi:hypothetical protein
METKERRYDLDWLRVSAFYILILYHVGMIFVPWDFHIKNSQTAEWFETWMAFLSQWRLPLLFMISGIVIYYSLGKRSGSEFIRERLKRLLIPLLFGMLVIVPPQIYYERVFNGVQYASYWDFWKTVFYFQPFPQGNFSWHHLWYVVYILVYSLLATPVFLYLRSHRSANLRQKTGLFLQGHPNIIYLIMLPMIVFYFGIAGKFPVTHDLIHDWYNHSISFSLFMFGFCIASIDGIWDVVAAKKKQSLIQAAVPGLFLILFVWGPTFELPIEHTEWFGIIYGILKMFMIPSLLLAIFGYGKVLLNRSGSLLSYLNESVYPLYILHQTVMIIFGYYIIRLDWGIMPKFLVTTLVTFGGSFLIYELLIKRNNISRVLFGLKTLRVKPLTERKEKAMLPAEG